MSVFTRVEGGVRRVKSKLVLDSAFAVPTRYILDTMLKEMNMVKISGEEGLEEGHREIYSRWVMGEEEIEMVVYLNLKIHQVEVEIIDRRSGRGERIFKGSKLYAQHRSEELRMDLEGLLEGARDFYLSR